MVTMVTHCTIVRRRIAELWKIDVSDWSRHMYWVYSLRTLLLANGPELIAH